MDESGVAAEVVFAGGQNFEELPFMGKGWNAGVEGIDTELRSAAQLIWNRWLADHVAANPDRLVGVLQNPVWDVDLAISEVESGASRGLRVLNLPAPRRDFAPYTDRAYDPLWQACADQGTVLVTHSGGGEEPLGVSGRRGRFLHIAENHWLGNRGLARIIFGGVFHRVPVAAVRPDRTAHRVRAGPGHPLGYRLRRGRPCLVAGPWVVPRTTRTSRAHGPRRPNRSGTHSMMCLKTKHG
jgi:hypothetical protein